MSAALPSYSEAAESVAAYAADVRTRRPGSQQVNLDAAFGRVLAQTLLADREMPSFPRSTRDGFACRAEEASTHQWLSLAGSVRAGDPPTGPLTANSAWEIMTGAPVPPGADAIAMVEHVENEGNRVRLTPPRTLQPGENIVPQGAEARRGTELVPLGTRLGPQHIAVSATCGYAEISVFVRPRVAILTTGDELVPVDADPAPGQIRNSNAAMLAALVAQAGGDPWALPAVKDRREPLEAALRQALDADMLLISGGVSAGKFDLVEPALLSLGAQFHFTGVRIQPGKPLVFGEVPRPADSRGPLPLFGLPGNPISSAATFLLFASQILAALAGDTSQTSHFSLARLTRDLKGKPGLSRFVPSCCQTQPFQSGPPQVEAVPWQGSGDLAAFARANCFTVVPEGVDRLQAGELVPILPF